MFKTKVDDKNYNRDKIFTESNNKVDALISPRNVVIIGASERPGSWGARVWNNLKRHCYPNKVYPMNPNREQVWGVECFPNFTLLPEPPDHVAIMLPAPQVPSALLEAASAGARSATIFSAGFGEGSASEGEALRNELVQVIEQTKLGVSGPNCVGNLVKKNQLVTLIEDRKQILDRGPIALIGQSGGSLMALNQCLEGRGLFVDYLITSGNEIGLSTADYIAYFAAQSQLKIIIVYIEHIADAERLQAAARLAADAGKVIVAFKLGHSDAGRKAALAHTGALAGTIQGFDAVYSSCGIVRVDSLDDLVEMAELVTRSGLPKGRNIGAITLSGAFRGILLDTAERAGVQFPKLSPATEEKLNSILSTGSYAGNPIDGGFSLVSDPAILTKCLTALNDDPAIDLILVQGALPREPGAQRAEKYIELGNSFCENKTTKPVAFVSFASYGLTDYSLELRSKASRVSFLQEASKTLGVVGSVVDSLDAQQRRARAEKDETAIKKNGERSARFVQFSEIIAKEKGSILNEADSKKILAAYGIESPKEKIVANVDQAVRAAQEIGYPVVLKLLSSDVLHKSDVGGVHLNLKTSEQLLEAVIAIQKSASSLSIPVEGFLVAQYVEGGIEMALGLHNDEEVGQLLMVSAGGVLLELIKDVQFQGPPISAEIARHMVDQLKTRKLLGGYRGKSVSDIEALHRAITQLGEFAQDCGDAIESVDINPMVVLPRGCLALDAVIVLKRS